MAFWRSKFNVSREKIVIDWIKFDSKLEAQFYEYMRDEPRISILEVHPKFELQPKYVRKSDKKTILPITYSADFRIDVEGDIYLVDVKGMETEKFQIKRKIFEYRRPDDKLLVVKSLKELRLAIF